MCASVCLYRNRTHCRAVSLAYLKFMAIFHFLMKLLCNVLHLKYGYVVLPSLGSYMSNAE